MKRKIRALQTVLLGVAVALSMVLSLTAAVKTAADYTYTVRVFSGNQGTIAGGDTVQVFTGLKTGDTVSFNPFDESQLTLKNPNKYYVLGLRESGKDNYDPEHPVIKVNETITVKGDMDYVVAYGVLSNSVAYTINYSADDGTLLDSKTYYGNVGDEAVIAFRYFEGYVPEKDSREQRFTLTDNAAANVMNFVYTKTETEMELSGIDEPASEARARQLTEIRKLLRRQQLMKTHQMNHQYPNEALK